MTPWIAKEERMGGPSVGDDDEDRLPATSHVSEALGNDCLDV
jgi:hypothetical protein